MCNKILLGDKGAAFASENYISFKGTLSLQLKNKDNGNRYWVTVIDDPNSIYSFCDLVCLQEYCDLKEKFRHDEYIAEKRRMNAEEWAKGPQRFPVGGGYSR